MDRKLLYTSYFRQKPAQQNNLGPMHNGPAGHNPANSRPSPVLMPADQRQYLSPRSEDRSEISVPEGIENPVTGVAQARHDKLSAVEFGVDGADVNICIGVLFADRAHAEFGTDDRQYF